MKLQPRHIVVLLALGIEALLACGCVNTAKGVQKDYQRAEDHVENAVK